MVQLRGGRGRIQTARGIYVALRDQIALGVYGSGEKLPSTRALAEELGVSRTTVTNAFEQLVSEGYVKIHQGARAIVVGSVRSAPAITNVPRSAERRLSQYGARALALPARASDPPGTIEFDFRYGDVAPEDFPKLAWRKAHGAAVLAHRDRLSYAHPAGSSELRQALQGYLWRARGIRCKTDQIMVVSGSQQALDLAARVLVDPGDKVVVEEPCYAMARNVLTALGATPTSISCDADGICTQELPIPHDYALVLVSPSHHFPLGGVLSAHRRHKLIEWAETGNVHIVEDDYDGEYRYDVRPIPPLFVGGRDRVIYVGTVSKTLAPTLRIGYLVLPEALVEPFVRCKQIMDRHSSLFEQETLAAFIETGAYERHIRKMRRKNAERRSVFLQAMHDSFGDAIEIVGTSAGLHSVVWFNDIKASDEQALAQTARRGDVGIYPVLPLYANPIERRAGFVFGYASMSLRVIPQAVNRLAEIVAAFRGAANC